MEFFNIELFGWLAAACFSLCGLPQAVKCFKEKHATGVSWGFLWLWIFGEIFATIYVLPRRDYPLLLNYFLNFVLICIILYYKFKGVLNDQSSK